MTTIDPGEYRHVVHIEEPTETQGDFTETRQDWGTFKKWRAKIAPISGREGWRYQQVDSVVTHEITMRFCRGVTTKMRVRYDDPVAGPRYFGIVSLLNTEERNVEHKLVCREGVQ